MILAIFMIFTAFFIELFDFFWPRSFFQIFSTFFEYHSKLLKVYWTYIHEFHRTKLSFTSQKLQHFWLSTNQWSLMKNYLKKTCENKFYKHFSKQSHTKLSNAFKRFTFMCKKCKMQVWFQLFLCNMEVSMVTMMCNLFNWLINAILMKFSPSQFGKINFFYVEFWSVFQSCDGFKRW